MKSCAKYLVLPALAAAVLCACGQGAPAARGNGGLAFDGKSGQGFNNEVFVMAPDGTGVRQLTQLRGEAHSAACSWDGKKIAFVYRQDRFKDDHQVHVMNADGGDPRPVTSGKGRRWGVAWSPDGSKLAFTHEVDNRSDVWVMNADGSGLVNLTNDEAADATTSGAWSPDGQKIVFSTPRFFPKGSQGSWAWELCVMDAKGGNVRRLTENADHYDGNACWSPAGNEIAFASQRDRKHRQTEIYVMNADGSNVRRITNDEKGSATNPAWSPDGKLLAFESKGDEFAVNLYIIKPDGSELKKLTNRGRMDAATRPSWLAK